MDLTGRFPYKSSRGNEYILIAYHFDSNVIWGLPVKNRQAKTLTNAWTTLHQKFAQNGLHPNTWILDNETSHELQSAMTKYNKTYQFVPPHTHRANIAERAIQTFKNHFKAGLASVHPDFPIAEWDRLLEQCFITLNLLRGSRLNPNLSAYAYMFGNFDFNRTPLAPPGTKSMIHSKPIQRATWDPNGKLGWYIGPSLQNYRCMRFYLPSTRAEVDTDTVTFIPHVIAIPEMNLEDFLRQATLDIVSLLTHPPASSVPVMMLGDNTKNGLLQLTTLLQTNALPPKLLNKQQHLTVNAAQQLQTQQQQQTPQSKSNFTPTITTSPSSTFTDTTHCKTLLDDIRQLARVYQQKKLQRILHGHKTLRKKVHPSDFTKPVNNFNNVHIPTSIVNHIYNDKGNKMSLESLLTGDQSIRWTGALSNELGRLTQGNDTGVTSQDAMDFISINEVPTTAKVTYANFVCDYRPLKDEPWRVRLVVGGDKLVYEFDSGSPAASLLETKILINSVISDAHKGARFMSLDLKDFFLATPMGTSEYMRIPLKYLPQDIIDKYDLLPKLHNGHIYCRIKKGMYGLKQAAILAFKQLKAKLKPHGYEPIPHTDGL